MKHFAIETPLNNLSPLIHFQFLGDPETVKKAMEAVAAQGKAK